MSARVSRGADLAFAALALAAWGSGCLVLPLVPDDAQLSCADDGGCPLGTVCRENIGRCVPAGAETEAPRVVEASLNRTRAALGDEIELRVVVDDDSGLFAAPEARLRGEPGAVFTLAFADEERGEYTYRYRTGGVEAEGEQEVEVALLDRFGNAAAAVAGTVTLDFTGPGLLAGADLDGVVIGRIQQLVLPLVVSEPLAAPPTVTLVSPGGSVVGTFDVDGAGTGYEARYTPAGTEDETLPHVVVVALEDLAGNTAEVFLEGSVRLDFTAPFLDVDLLALSRPDLPWSLDLPAAGVGTRVSLGFTLDSPVAALAVSSVPNLEWTVTQSVEGDTLAEAVVDAAVPDGSVSIEVEVTDLYENTAVRVASVFDVDTQSPLPPAVDADSALVYHRDPAADPAAGDTHRLTVAPLSVEDGARLVVLAGPTEDAPVMTIAEPPSGDHPLLPIDVVSPWVVAVDGAGNRSTPVRVRDVVYVAGFGPGPHGTRHQLETTAWFRGLAEDPTAALAPSSSAAAADGVVALVEGGATFWRAEGDEGPLGRKDHVMVADAVTGGVVVHGGIRHVQSSCDGSGLEYCAGPWRFTGATFRAAPLTDPEGDGHPSARFGSAATYDPVRRRLLLFGGKDSTNDCDASGSSLCGGTWGYDGESWTRLAVTGPPARVQAELAWDGAREEAVLFGGTPVSTTCPLAAPFPQYLGDVWVHDGAGWVEQTPAGDLPPPRGFHSMAFDEVSGRTLVFGGISRQGDCSPAQSPLADTWAWDGDAFVELTPASSAPGARRAASMTFDRGRQAVVLFGGEQQGAGLTNDLYVWEDEDWKLVDTGPVAPAPRRDAALVYAEALGGLVLFGGQALDEGDGICPDGEAAELNVCYLSDLWLLGPAGWRPLWPSATVAAGTVPPPRQEAGLAFDGQASLLLVGGAGDGACDAPGLLCDVWAFDGARWGERTVTGLAGGPPAALLPGGLVGDALVFSSFVEVACGADTCNGTQALAVGAFDEVPLDGAQGPERPQDLTGYAVSMSPGGVLLFGGSPLAAPATELDQSFLFDGQVWTPLSGAAPLPRVAAAMAFDEAAGEVVLFGGHTCDSALGCGDIEVESLGDTWVFDGSGWVEHVQSDGPPARTGHRLAYDPDRGRVVLFGGHLGANGDCGGATRFCSDLWEWTGQAWSRVAIVDLEEDGSPSARADFSWASDPLRQEVVMFGGRGPLDDTWVYRGGASVRPAVVTTVDVSATGLLGIAQVVAVAVSAVGGGVGAGDALLPGSSSMEGAALLLFAGDGFVVHDANESPPTAPSSLTATLTDLASVQRVVGAGGTLVVAVAPRGPNGKARERASASLDWIEVALTLRLPAEP